MLIDVGVTINRPSAISKARYRAPLQSERYCRLQYGRISLLQTSDRYLQRVAIIGNHV